MKKQIQIYSLDTMAFYTKEEKEISIELSWFKSEKYAIEDYALFSIIIADFDIIIEKNDINFICKYSFRDYSDFKDQRDNDKYLRKFIKKLLKDNKSLKKTDEYKNELIKFPIHEVYINKITTTNKLLSDKIKNSDNKLIRRLNSNVLKKYNKISIFESSFTRTLDFKINETTTDIMVVKVTDKKFYPIMEQLVNNSFTITNEYDKFVALTATAGQIRVKKIIFIREYIYRQYIQPLMCGLSIEDINNSELKGCNVNKFLAYLGLIFSDSDKWEEFDINRAIVVEDFETKVYGEVDYIDDKTFEVTPSYMPIPITHSDGCGWILPSESKKNFQFRAPWLKGLLTPVNYLLYCEKFNNNNYKIVDIYGKEWDLKENDIRYVFFKSQFKMWKYYPNIPNEDGSVKEYGWDTYKENFTKFNCHASKCHEETGEFKTGRFNYQMAQTLTDIREDELEQLIKPTKELITNAYTNKDAMLEVLGVGKNNKNKNNLQQALELYPELLNDYHVKKELMESISAKRNDAKFARIKIDAKSTFIIPDPLAWLEYIFSKDKTIVPKGLLADGEVYCRLFKSPKLICNRSPHLYKEHAVRRNVANEFISNNWFCTDGLYTSSHDLISKLLQFDNDGDSSLVIADKNLINVCERNMKGVLPLYYRMGKAEPEIINNKSIYESIKMAWKYGNIGTYSNRLTKFWNNYDRYSDLNLAKILCSINNFSIDAAKCKFLPEIPEHINNWLKDLNKSYMPYFAQFAKDELEGKVSERNESTVNRLCAKIEEIKIHDYDFTQAGKFKKAMLMNNPRIVVNEAVTKKYDELNDLKDTYFRDAKRANLTKDEVATSIYTQIKNELLQSFPELSILEITDMIIKHIFPNKDCRKSFLFNCFGDIIVENLKKNLDGTFQCSVCYKRVKRTGNNQKMCETCSDNKIKEKDRSRKKKK